MSELPSSQADSVSEADLYEDWSAHPIKVGEFIINFNERYAEAPDGEKRNITPNSIKLLLLLLHNSSSYVSLADIHKFVYGNQYKDDSSTRKQVTSLRKLFDDTAKEKHYIENKLGHGYRLVAPVEFIEEELEEEGKVQEGKKPNFNVVIWAFSILLVPLVLVFAYFSINTTQDGSKPLDYLFGKPAPITHLKGLELYPSLSPDGKWLLFTYKPENEEQWKLYVRDMETGELINLTHSIHTERMARWVSDEKVLYSRVENNICNFYISTFDKGSKELSNEEKLVACNLSSQLAQGELWQDNQGMYFNLAESINAPFIIYSHSFSTKEKWPIASPPPSGKGDYYFKLSKDGKKLAVLRNKNWSQTEVWIYNTTSWETHLVETVNTVLYTVNWTNDSSSVVYKNDANQIVRYILGDSKKEILAQPSIPVLSPLLKENGDLIFAAGSLFKNDLYKQELTTGNIQPIENSSYHDLIPAVSKDGSQLAWVSNRTGVFQVWLKREEGESSKQITHLVNNLKFVDLSFSPDGTKLGGSASGRWFVIDLNDLSVTWASDEVYYKNFQWKRSSKEAFLAKKHMEQWEQITLNVSTFETSVTNIPVDAFIVLEDSVDDVTYIASFKKSGFWRVQNDRYSDAEYFEPEEPINMTGRWVATKRGLLFTSFNKLYLLSKSSSQVTEVNLAIEGKWISSPWESNWVITTESTEGETDIMHIKRIFESR